MSAILIVAGDQDEAFQLAHMMGWRNADVLFVTHYRDILRYRGASVYITGTARERQDFGAIEGLFLMGQHTVVDMND